MGSGQSLVNTILLLLSHLTLPWLCYGYDDDWRDELYHGFVTVMMMIGEMNLPWLCYG